MKKVFLKISHEACNFIEKEIPIQVFSYKFCQIFNSISLTDYLWTTASVYYFPLDRYLFTSFGSSGFPGSNTRMKTS